MKKQKITVIMLVALAFMMFTLSSFAQDSTKKLTPEAKATKITEKMKTALNLTDEQYTQIYALNLKQMYWKKDNKKSDLTEDQIKTKREEFKTDLKKILTNEQMVKLKDLKKKHHKTR